MHFHFFRFISMQFADLAFLEIQRHNIWEVI